MISHFLTPGSSGLYTGRWIFERSRPTDLHSKSQGSQGSGELGEACPNKNKNKGEGKCLSCPGTSQVARTHEVTKRVLNNARKVCIVSV